MWEILSFPEVCGALGCEHMQAPCQAPGADRDPAPVSPSVPTKKHHWTMPRTPPCCPSSSVPIYCPTRGNPCPSNTQGPTTCVHPSPCPRELACSQRWGWEQTFVQLLFE